MSVRVVGRNLVAGRTYYGKMHLIDLAGSERVGRSGATGQALEEAKVRVDLSLHAEWECRLAYLTGCCVFFRE